MIENNEIKEESSGGTLLFRTLDGKNIVKNYNYGEWQKNYLLIVQILNGGKVLINEKEYDSTFYQSYPRGTNINLTAIPDEGKSFVKWSDGVGTPTRQITIIEDIEIYPIFE